MDNRTNPRPANKRYRVRANYIDTAVKIDKDVMAEVEIRMKDFTENNLSEYIENATTPFLPPAGTRKRKWKTYPVRKTLTFTEGYVKELKKTENVSLAVEELLIKALKLKIK